MSWVRVALSITLAVGIHALLLKSLTLSQEQNVRIQGDTISVTYGAGGLSTQAASVNRGAQAEAEPSPADESSMTERSVEEPKETSRVDPFEEVVAADVPVTSQQEVPSDDELADRQTETVVESSEASEVLDNAEQVVDEGLSSVAQTDDGASASDSVATSAQGSPDTDPNSETVQTEEGNAASDNYAGEVLKHLSRVRRPRSPGTGVAIITFTIAPDGSLEEVEVAESSGSRRFDREALRVVERGEPYPLPPAGANRTFTVEIEGR